MKQPLISVVVPLYGVADTMGPCVDGILAQTYPHLEVLLVDDGSPDACGAIADAYAQADRRVRVIHQPNRGLAAARNTGTAAAQGELITYVDGDDLIAPECVQTLWSLMERQGADIAVCPMRRFRPPETPFCSNGRDGQEAVFSGREALEHMLYQRLFDTSACGKLYRTADAQACPFPEGWLFEDLATVYRLLWRARTVAWTGRVLYGYRVRPASIMTGEFDPRRLDELRAMEQLRAFVEENCPECQTAADCRLFSCLCQVYLALPATPVWQQEARKLWHRMRRLSFRVLTTPHARIKNRCAAILTLPGEKIFRCVAHLTRKES